MATTQAPPIDVEHDGDDSDASEPEALPGALIDRLETVGQNVGAFVRERPLAAVGIALLAGFLVGRMIR